MRVVAHGGAGPAPNDPEKRQGVLDEAAAAGADAGTPVGAVEATVRRMESSPRFSAGVGSAYQADGRVRTDAGIMTSARDAGAACSMPGVEHAVSAARAVMEGTPHVLVSGEGAVSLAAESGIETGVDLSTERTRERFDEADPPDGYAERLAWVRDRFGAGNDTVGAVAREGDRIAAATSTGGRWFALSGRVGDVPQVGSGFFASPAAGASATGAGEEIAKATLSRRAVRHVEAGRGAAEAADLAIAEFGELTGASAGIIVLDNDGGVGSAYNSEAMQVAAARD